MKLNKESVIRHIVFAFLLLIIGFTDFMSKDLLPSNNNFVISVLIKLAFIIIFISLSHIWYRLPYMGMFDKIDEYYKDLINDISCTKDTNSNLAIQTRISNLEELINLYKSRQKQQKELVYQLTNTNKILDQNNKFANAIVQITSEILHSGDKHNILQLILDKAIEIIPNAQKGSILLYNNGFLEYKAMYGYDMEALKDFKFGFNEIFQSKAKDLYEPIIVNNVEEFNKNLKMDKFKVLKETRSFELNSSISCAFSIDNQFYGTINIDNNESNNAFIDEHKPIIKYFAEQIGLALKNAILLEKILYMSQYDSLTSACNRAYFEERLNILHNNCVQEKRNYALVLLDINDLKIANDTFGHITGDKLIITLTDYISNVDPKPTIFGRVGGDEFALIYTDKSNSEVHQIMQNIRTHFIEVPFKYNNQEIMNITFGYGVSNFPDEGEEITTLFKNADYLMYIDKRRFKDSSI